MARGSNPHNVLARLLMEAQRLDTWAQQHGTPKQREITANLIKLHQHIGNIFHSAGIEETTQANPNG